MPTSNKTAATVAAKLAPPADRTPETLYTTTTSQVAAIKACPDWLKQQGVQAATTQLDTDNTTLGVALATYEKARAALPGLRSAALAAVATVRRDRHSVAGALTVASAGDTAAIEAWGATPVEHVALPVETTAPVPLVLMGSKTPGTVKVRCASIDGAASYLWSVTADTSAPAATPVITTGTRLTLTGQVIGHVLFVRAAVVRRRGGQSVWSDALQITVR